MKKIFTVFTTIIFLLNASPVSAHFLVTDKNIGAVLHVDPGDEPVVGQLTSFFFEFKDKDNKFDPKNCECIFTITDSGKTVYTQPLYQNTSSPSLSNGVALYTFSKEGAYEIKVTGKRTAQNEFSSFSLEWNLRVVKGSDGASSAINSNSSFFSTHTVHLIIIGIGVVVFFVLIKNNSKKKEKVGDKK